MKGTFVIIVFGMTVLFNPLIAQAMPPPTQSSAGKVSRYAEVQVERELTHIREINEANAKFLGNAIVILSILLTVALVGPSLMGYFTLFRPSEKSQERLNILIDEIPQRIELMVRRDRERLLSLSIHALSSPIPAHVQRAIAFIEWVPEEDFSTSHLNHLLDMLPTLGDPPLSQIVAIVTSFQNPGVLAALERILQNPVHARNREVLKIILRFIHAKRGDAAMVRSLAQVLQQASPEESMGLVQAAYEAFRTNAQAIYAIFDDDVIVSAISEDHRELLRKWATGYSTNAGSSPGNALLTVQRLNRTKLFQNKPAHQIFGADGKALA